MSYERFERLVIGLGAVIILGSFAFSLPSGSRPEPVEIAAQFFLLAILLAAIRTGRKGGLTAAVVASAVYAGMRIMSAPAAPLTGTTSLLIASRIGAFVLLGIIGGEAAARMRYAFTRFEDGTAIDEWTNVFNERYAARSISQALARSARYEEPFSVIVMTLSPSLFAGFQPGRQRSIVRGIAEHIRSDLRMVDEVARLDDGRFVLILPHTPKEGGQVVADRVCAATRAHLGARPETVTCESISGPEDFEVVKALLDTLDQSEVEGQSSSTR
jgi:GGDEF domain-containing protein